MIKKIFLLSFTFIIAFTLFSFTRKIPAPPQQKTYLHTIIIDPGHGGKDNGAHGAYSYEKNICLAIALKLGKKIKETFPHIKVLFTRTKDTYPPIKERADFANRNNGDLFISIHANAMPAIRHRKFIGYRTVYYYKGKGKSRKRYSRKVRRYKTYYTHKPSHGTETYIWAADRSDEKGGFVTDRISEEVSDSEYSPNVNDPVFQAQSLIWTKQYFNKSLMLASMVEDEFQKEGRMSRGVKQRNWRGIWVLQATAMPSILVETGFLTYPSEEKYLNSQKGQNEVAEAILKAVKRYRAATSSK